MRNNKFTPVYRQLSRHIERERNRMAPAVSAAAERVVRSLWICANNKPDRFLMDELLKDVEALEAARR